MQTLLRIISLVLRYPDEDTQSVAQALLPELRDGGLDRPDEAAALMPLIERLGSGDLIELQSDYVETFDRGRAHSLHLFEHVHGESRDRGQALVDVRERYEAAGLEIVANELPDYLPLYLEYLSVLPPEQAQDELAQPGLIYAAIGERLTSRQSPYATVFDVLTRLAGISEDDASEAGKSLPPADNPDDLEALDKAWEDEQVRFGPGSPEDGCPQVRDILNNMAVPAAAHLEQPREARS